MQTRFAASESVLINIPQEPVPIQHYLRQPHRLVYALFDPSRIEPLADECFRLKLQPLTFIMVNIQPIVDVRVQAAADGAISVRSIACEIRGIEYFNRGFSLNLSGELHPRYRQGKPTQLEGTANLGVQVELPLVLRFTPRPLIEVTGNNLLKHILQTIKRRLTHQLPADYSRWARSSEAEETRPSRGLSTEPPAV